MNVITLKHCNLGHSLVHHSLPFSPLWLLNVDKMGAVQVSHHKGDNTFTKLVLSI